MKIQEQYKQLQRYMANAFFCKCIFQFISFSVLIIYFICLFDFFSVLRWKKFIKVSLLNEIKAHWIFFFFLKFFALKFNSTFLFQFLVSRKHLLLKQAYMMNFRSVVLFYQKKCRFSIQLWTAIIHLFIQYTMHPLGERKMSEK